MPITIKIKYYRQNVCVVIKAKDQRFFFSMDFFKILFKTLEIFAKIFYFSGVNGGL